MTRRKALFPGTFDPVTLGHLDLLRRALDLFDEIVVAVARGGSDCLLPHEERVALFAQAVGEWSKCRVVPFSGLLVDEMRQRKVDVVVRGIRSFADYEHEWAMAQMNRTLYRRGEWFFLLAKPELAALSSSLVRDVARHGGELGGMVVPEVAAALERHFAR